MLAVCLLVRPSYTVQRLWIISPLAHGLPGFMAAFISESDGLEVPLAVRGQLWRQRDRLLSSALPMCWAKAASFNEGSAMKPPVWGAILFLCSHRHLFRLFMYASVMSAMGQSLWKVWWGSQRQRRQSLWLLGGWTPTLEALVVYVIRKLQYTVGI